MAIKSNTGNVFPDILSSFRILVCYTSSTNDRNSYSLTDNLKQSVKKVEFLQGNFNEFLGAFAKATISRVVFVRPSVRPSFLMEQLGSQWEDFHERHFSKICRENSTSIKI